MNDKSLNLSYGSRRSSISTVPNPSNSSHPSVPLFGERPLKRVSSQNELTSETRKQSEPTFTHTAPSEVASRGRTSLPLGRRSSMSIIPNPSTLNSSGVVPLFGRTPSEGILSPVAITQKFPRRRSDSAFTSSSFSGEIFINAVRMKLDKNKEEIISTIKDHPKKGQVLAYLAKAILNKDREGLIMALSSLDLGSESIISSLLYLIQPRGISISKFGFTNSFKLALTDFLNNLQDIEQLYAFANSIDSPTITFLKNQKITFDKLIDNLINLPSYTRTSLSNPISFIQKFVSIPEQANFYLRNINNQPDLIIKCLLETFSEELIEHVGKDKYVQFASNILLRWNSSCTNCGLNKLYEFISYYGSNLDCIKLILTDMAAKNSKFNSLLIIEGIREQYGKSFNNTQPSDNMEKWGESLFKRAFKHLLTVFDNKEDAITFISNIIFKDNNRNLNLNFLNLFNNVKPKFTQLIIGKLLKGLPSLKESLISLTKEIEAQIKEFNAQELDSVNRKKVAKLLFRQYYPLLLIQGLSENDILTKICNLLNVLTINSEFANLFNDFIKLVKFANLELLNPIIVKLQQKKDTVQTTLFSKRHVLLKEIKKLLSEKANDLKSMEKLSQILFRQFYVISLCLGNSKEEILREVGSMLSNFNGNIVYSNTFYKIIAGVKEEDKKLVIARLAELRPNYLTVDENDLENDLKVLEAISEEDPETSLILKGKGKIKE